MTVCIEKKCQTDYPQFCGFKNPDTSKCQELQKCQESVRRVLPVQKTIRDGSDSLTVSLIPKVRKIGQKQAIFKQEIKKYIGIRAKVSDCQDFSEKDRLMKRTLITLISLSVGLLAVGLFLVATITTTPKALASGQRAYFVSVNDRTNYPIAERMRHDQEKAWTAQRIEQLELMREAAESDSNDSQDEVWEFVPEYYYSDVTAGYSGHKDYQGSNFRSDGVWYQDGVRFTWYSDNENTGALAYGGSGTVGDDGIYRDSDGYVMVAGNSSEYSGGEIVSTPFGDGKIYDSGCSAGTLDIYTNF